MWWRRLPSWRCSGYTTLTTLSQTRGNSNSVQWQTSITGPFLGCSHLPLRLQNGSTAPPKQWHQFKRDFQDSADMHLSVDKSERNLGVLPAQPPQELHLLSFCHLSPSSLKTETLPSCQLSSDALPSPDTPDLGCCWGKDSQQLSFQFVRCLSTALFLLNLWMDRGNIQ